jgi:hypothetical protein
VASPIRVTIVASDHPGGKNRNSKRWVPAGAFSPRIK